MSFLKGLTNEELRASAVLTSSGFTIPEFDYFICTYVGVTNNIATTIYKTGGAGGATVATLTFTYIAAGAANDDNIATVTKS